MSTEQWDVEEPEGDEGEETPPDQRLPKPAREHTRKLEKELAEQRRVNEENAQRIQTFERRERFEASRIAAEADGNTLDVSVEDLGDLPADQITPALLKAKHEEKGKAKRDALAEQAKMAGFDDVDEFLRSVEEVKARRAETITSMGSQAAVAATGPGQPPAEASETERVWDAYNAAIKAGKSADEARSEMVRVKREIAMGIKPTA